MTKLFDDGAIVHVRLVGECPVRLWGLTTAERLRRQLVAVGGSGSFLPDDEVPPPGSSIVLLRTDYLFDDRTLRDLLAAKDVVVSAGRSDPILVAAHVGAEFATKAQRVLLGQADPSEISPVRVTTASDLSSAFLGPLCKSVPPVVLRIDADRKTLLERRLFDASYKGVTDLVTKWVWPTPALRAVRLCAHLGVRPNHVTAMSLVFTIAAIVLFAQGAYGAGLFTAWLMTFLDTVDGKLARVTVDSSYFGHIFDHAIDVIHPPIWYVAWGVGLHSFEPPLPGFSLDMTFAVIVGGYVVGRLLEAIFDFWLGKFSIFSWRPIDSYVRLIIARRNPSLLLLTASAALGRPDTGLVAVAIWTVASTIFLAVRLWSAARTRLRREPIEPWLANIATDGDAISSLARPFVRRGEDLG